MRFRPIVRAAFLLLAVGIVRIGLHAQAAPQNPCATPSARCASYEVVIEFVGYIGLADSADCKVNPRGYDRLTGTLSAIETSERDEDVVYTGTLKRETAIDVARRKAGAGRRRRPARHGSERATRDVRCRRPGPSEARELPHDVAEECLVDASDSPDSVRSVLSGFITAACRYRAGSNNSIGLPSGSSICI